MTSNSKHRGFVETEAAKKSYNCFLLNVDFVVSRLCRVALLAAPYQHSHHLDGPRDDKIRHEAKCLAEATSLRLLLPLKVALDYTGQSFFPNTVDLSKFLV